MTEQPKNPWLEAAKAMSEQLKQEPKEIQDTQRDLSRKIYPETWKARRERNEETD